MTVDEIIQNEELRREQFPVVGQSAYLTHGGVSPLPKAAGDAMSEFVERGLIACQETSWSDAQTAHARAVAARLLNADDSEIALLGPTSLGINLVAQGLDWNAGDEVVCYGDDYPANVYPWRDLERHGVKVVELKPDHTGVITWDLIESVLSDRTRLVALASCHFLSGYRPDIEGIGAKLHERGILFSVDAIQTLGAWPLDVTNVDFLSADSHKWLLGPVGAGIFYVSKDVQERHRPTLLGSWNVFSPDYIAQDTIRFYKGGRRYEPGTLNLPGIFGMAGAMEMLLDVGIENMGPRILRLREHLLADARPLGYRLYLDELDTNGTLTDADRSGIVSIYHPDKEMKPVFEKLKEAHVMVALRVNRAGQKFLRFSPHFYNTEGEIDRALDVLSEA